MVELAKKVYLFIFVAFICQKLFFHKYFLKGSRKSNQSSKHLSQRVVIKVRFFTLLYIGLTMKLTMKLCFFASNLGTLVHNMF